MKRERRASLAHKPWTYEAIENHKLIRRLLAESALFADNIAGTTVSRRAFKNSDDTVHDDLTHWHVLKKCFHHKDH